MEEENKQTELEVQNRLLQEQIAKLEKELANRRVRSGFRVLRLFVKTYATRPLYSSVSKLVDEVADRKVERDTIKDVLYATLRRLTRVGMITLSIALAPLIMAVLQTYYLRKQNEKLDIQNKRIEQQTYLQEAERRSSLVLLFDNVLSKIDEELRANPARRELSPQLIGRIAALTKALKPYRFLEGDTITGRMSSPERGQVLLSLLASKLHPATCEQLFLLADFSYATLQNVSFDGAYLRNINLSNAVLQSVSMTGADLRNANFQHAEFSQVHVQLTGARARPARFDFANFYQARIADCDFSGSSFEYSNFAGASLRDVIFQRAFFKKTNFTSVLADTLDFSESTLLQSTFSLQQGKGSKQSAADFRFADIQVDTNTFAQIVRLPLGVFPVLDPGSRQFHINRDTFYPDDKSQGVVVADSVLLFRTKN